MAINTQRLYDDLGDKYGTHTDRFQQAFIRAVNNSIKDFNERGHLSGSYINGLDDVDIDEKFEPALYLRVCYYLNLEGEWSINDMRDFEALSSNAIRYMNMDYYLDEDNECVYGLGDLS